MIENFSTFNKVAPLIKTCQFRLIPDSRLPEGVFDKELAIAKKKAEARTVIQRVVRRVIGQVVEEQVLRYASDIIKLDELEEYYKTLQKKNTADDYSDNEEAEAKSTPRTKLCAAIDKKVKDALKPIEERKTFSMPVTDINTLSIYRYIKSSEEKDAADLLQKSATIYYPDKYALGKYYSSKVGSVSNRIFVDNFPIYCKNMSYIKDASKFIQGFTRFTTVAEFLECVTTNGIACYNDYISYMNQAINQYKQEHKKKIVFGKKLKKNLCMDKEVIEIRECSVEEIAETVINFDEELHKSELSNFGSNGEPVLFDGGIRAFASEITIDNAENVSLTKKFVNQMVHKDNNMLDADLVKSKEYTLAELLETKSNDLDKLGLVKFVNPTRLIDDYLHYMSCEIAALKTTVDKKQLQEHCVEYHRLACELRRLFKRYNDNRLDEVYEQMSGLGGINQLFNKNFGLPEPSVEIPINFSCNQLFAGWSFTKLGTDKSALLVKNNKYYIAVCPHFTPTKQFDYKDESEQAHCYKMLSVTTMKLPLNLARYDEMRPYLKMDNYRDKIDFILNTSEKMPVFSRFRLKEKLGNVDYNCWNEFSDDIGYNAAEYDYKYISDEEIDEKVRKGEIYLFEVSCRDFQDNMRKKKNHKNNVNSRIFEAFFLPENQWALAVWINAYAKIKFRPGSDKFGNAVHKAGQPIACKSKKYEGRYSVRSYDIVKDRRFTKDQFTLDITFTLNYNTRKSLAVQVMDAKTKWFLENVWTGNCIGIDRGERNLCYITVVDKDKKILYQTSMNICNDVDYNEKLESLGKDRKDSQKRFVAVPHIKNLKNGYISALVNEVVKLMIKYDAVISLENLSCKFMETRAMIDKQVYKKIEDALVKKLSCYIPNVANADENAIGGVMNPYQMAYRDQYGLHGLIFNVNPKYTSKCDFNTGAHNVFPSLSSDTINTKEKKVKFLEKHFNGMYYNGKTDMFELDTDLLVNLDGKNMLMETYGIRSRYNRKNHEMDLLNLTEEFNKLLSEYNVPLNGNIMAYILDNKDILKDEFFVGLFRLFGLTTQMRNSYKTVDGREVDEIVSPCRDENGNFYRTGGKDSRIPVDGDANGAYGIARKGYKAVEKFIEYYGLTKEDKKKKKAAVKNIHEEYFNDIMQTPVAM